MRVKRTRLGYGTSILTTRLAAYTLGRYVADYEKYRRQLLGPM